MSSGHGADDKEVVAVAAAPVKLTCFENFGVIILAAAIVLWSHGIVHLMLGGCPLLLVRAMLQIGILGISFMTVLFVLRVRQILRYRTFPTVPATVAKLVVPSPQVMEMRAYKEKALCCFTQEGTRACFIRFEEGRYTLPREPICPEEASGMFAVTIEEDNPVAVEDPIDVVLQDGRDPSKCLYIPHQEAILRSHTRNLMWSSLCFVGAGVGIYFTGGFFTGPIQWEERLSIVGCSVDHKTVVDYCLALLAPITVFGVLFAMIISRRNRLMAKMKVEQANCLLAAQKADLCVMNNSAYHSGSR